MNDQNSCKVIIPVFYPGKIVVNCINSIPKNFEIFILDNGLDDYNLENEIKKLNREITIYKVGDVGVAQSFNFALSKITSEFFFITQPDVTIKKNCIENLIKSAKVYKDAAILSPVIYEEGLYSEFDFYNLKITKEKKISKNQKKKEKNREIKEPVNDFNVDAINSTALLVKTAIIKEVGGWDSKFYTYLEDIDISLRVRQLGYKIIKIVNSKADHLGFSSHKIENKESIDRSRNWHFSWSSVYFASKHYDKWFFYKILIKKMLKYLLKIFVNIILFRKKKLLSNYLRLNACVSFLKNKKSYYRPKKIK